MNGWQFFKIFFFLLLILLKKSYALTSLESLIFGDLSKGYVENIQDPLDYIFHKRNMGEETNGKKLRNELVLYRGFIEEGEGLQNFCKNRPTLNYNSPWKKSQATQSLLSNLQYIGLDITSRAIAKYSQYFEFTKNDHQNMVDGLVGNFCSQNLSTISLKSLKKNLYLKFNENHSFLLPAIGQNHLFPEKLKQLSSEEIAKKNEFYLTIELFKTFCSWGSDIHDLRLLVPLVKNAQIMSFIIRQMSSLKLQWSEFEKGLKLEKFKGTSKTLCQGQICRKSYSLEFNAKFPRSIGSISVVDDLKRIYCESLRDAHYVLNDGPPKLKMIIGQRTFDDDHLLASQFIALLTNVPDFFIRGQKFRDVLALLSSSMDSSWENWSKKKIENLEKELLFEEPLTIELVERHFYYNPSRPEFKVMLDVNLGEFDRVFQIRGKLKTSFNLELSKGMISWVRRSFLYPNPKEKGEALKVQERVEESIINSIEIAKFKFKRPPWKKKLEKLIAKELVYQIIHLEEDPYEIDDKGMVVIPVQLNYGVFALKYMHTKHLIQKNQLFIKRALKAHEEARQAWPELKSSVSIPVYGKDR